MFNDKNCYFYKQGRKKVMFLLCLTENMGFPHIQINGWPFSFEAGLVMVPFYSPQE